MASSAASLSPPSPTSGVGLEQLRAQGSANLAESSDLGGEAAQAAAAAGQTLPVLTQVGTETGQQGAGGPSVPTATSVSFTTAAETTFQRASMATIPEQTSSQQHPSGGFGAPAPQGIPTPPPPRRQRTRSPGRLPELESVSAKKLVSNSPFQRAEGDIPPAKPFSGGPSPFQAATSHSPRRSTADPPQAFREHGAHRSGNRPLQPRRPLSPRHSAWRRF